MLSSTGLGQVSCKLAATMLTTTDTLSQQCQVSTSLSTLDTVSQQVSTMWSELSSFPCQDTGSAWGRCQAVVRISEGRRRWWRGDGDSQDMIWFVSSQSLCPHPHPHLHHHLTTLSSQNMSNIKFAGILGVRNVKGDSNTEEKSRKC